MPLNITQSHQIETLFYKFAFDIQQHQQAIFNLHHVVTPNPAVKQWLIQRISQHFGVCSQIQWHQNVNELEWFLYQVVAQDKDQVRKANLPRVVMKWQIYQCLLKFIDKPSNQVPEHHDMYGLIQRIYHYCEHISDELQARLRRQQMAYWLSEQIAQIFRHYMRYRPDWLIKWSSGIPLNVESLLNQQDQPIPLQMEKAVELEGWQRALWKHLFAEYYQRIVDIKDDFFVQDNLAQQLPECIYIFTLLDLAPTEWAFLRRLSHYTRIEIYHFSATQEYWADSVDPRWKAEQDEKIRQRLLAKFPEKNLQQIQDYIYAEYGFDAQLREDRHPILTRFGKQARDNFSLLADLSGGEHGGEWTDLFGQVVLEEGVFDFQEEIIFSENLLGRLQQDIFYLMNPESKGFHLDVQDKSIQFHVCHSTLRQLEVLKEQLNLWLAESTVEQPRHLHDVLVLAPDIQELEPFIRRVFVGKDSPAINITGILPLHIRALWQAFIFPITWVRGRFTLDDVLDWLNLSAIKQFYQLNDVQIERIGFLLNQAGFKRGFDAQHLKATLSEYDQDFRYSFKYALDRLAMSLAIGMESVCPVVLDDEQNPYIVSMQGVQYDDFALIVILLEMYQYFHERRDWLEQHDILVENWLQKLLQEIQQFQKKNVDSTDVLQKVIKQYDRMLSLTYNYEQLTNTTTGYTLKQLKLPLWDILQEIQSQLESLQDDMSFTGRINFSQIGKIRPLPYKLIILLNMDNGVFPNRDYPKAFDLLNYVRPKLGDRSRLEDHQGAFLDAILQAQQQVWFFYTGFDVDSGEILDPSSVLIEFQRHLAQIIYHQDVVNDVDLQGLKVAEHLAPLYYVHSAQPFIAEGYLNPQIIRQQDDWFNIAQVLYQPDTPIYPTFQQIDSDIWSRFLQTPIYPPLTHFDELVNKYQLDTQQIIQINANYWIKLLRFPALLYLDYFNISNHQGDKHLIPFEPLILNHLEQYQLLDRLLEQNKAFDQQHIDLHFEPNLPVGKIKQVYWQNEVALQQEMLHKLMQYQVTTEVSHQIWQWHNIQFNLLCPKDKTCQIWGRVFATSGKGKHRLAIWLEYLLWIASLELGHVGADYQMVCVFKDQVIIQKGIHSNQAQHMILQWLDLYFAGQRQPLLLPADLLLDEQKFNSQLAEDKVLWHENHLNEQGMALAYKLWSTIPFEMSYIKESNIQHHDWQLLLQHVDSEALLYKTLQQYSRLYAPIWQFQYVDGESS